VNATVDGQLRRELESALVAGLEAINATQWTAFELSTAFDDLLNLSRGKDAMYDRPSIGWLYASWYQARRLQDALRLLTPALDAATRPIRVVDFGAGTGATLWAVAAYNRRRVINGLPVRPVVYSGIESSNPMLRVGRALAATLFNGSTFAGTVEDWAFTIGNWCDAPVQRSEDHDTIVTACYLLDDSDRERAGDIVTLLARQAVAAGASTLAVTTTKTKIGTVHAIDHSDAWEADPAQSLGAMWTGSLKKIQRLRGTVLTNVARYRSFPAAPSWASDEGETRTFQRTRSGRLFDLPAQRSLTLDDDQDRAAEPDGRMTAIIGAAGSGKSRVLIERVARTLELRTRAEGPANILVTTFNKDMVEQLGTWLNHRIRGGQESGWKPGRDRQNWTFTNLETDSKIHVRNWDKVHAVAFGLSRHVEEVTEGLVARRIKALDDRGIPRPLSGPEILSSAFAEAELRRVIFGLGLVEDTDTYLTVERAGRRKPLNRQQRLLIWNLLMPPEGEWFTWPHRRMDALSSARALQRPVYDHVFIDECQDMTRADFEIAARLVADPSNLVIAGDEAQALHLGPSYRRVGQMHRYYAAASDKGPEFRLWQHHRLTGSYRLPLRICEAVQPLAEAIANDRAAHAAAHDVVAPDTRRGAVLGARPIITSRSNAEQCLREALIEYSDLLDAMHPGARRVSFADAAVDDEVDRRLPGLPPRFSVVKETMLKIKGLERAVIVWNSWNPIASEEAADEWIYTILTRTCGLAFILVDSEDTTDEAAIAISRLRRDRLTAWDEEAAAELDAVVQRGERLRGD